MSLSTILSEDRHNFAKLLATTIRHRLGSLSHPVIECIVPSSCHDLAPMLRKELESLGCAVRMIVFSHKLYPTYSAYFTHRAQNQSPDWIRQQAQGIDGEIEIMTGLDNSISQNDLVSYFSSQPYKTFRQYVRDKKINFSFASLLACWPNEVMVHNSRQAATQYAASFRRAYGLDKSDPFHSWQSSLKLLHNLRSQLNDIKIQQLRFMGERCDLNMSLGRQRSWLAGRGSNMPSSEVFTSPDWRTVSGWIHCSIPVYILGSKVMEDVRLEFKSGALVSATAEFGQDLLSEIIRIPGADKVGEISLTDKRLSRIESDMGINLLNENIGGSYGNMHLALGRSFPECIVGEEQSSAPPDVQDLGLNQSSLHVDFVTTGPMEVTAENSEGSSMLYKDGEFLLS